MKLVFMLFAIFVAEKSFGNFEFVIKNGSEISIDGYQISSNSNKDGVCVALGYSKGHVDGTFETSKNFHLWNSSQIRPRKFLYFTGRVDETVKINNVGRIETVYTKPRFVVSRIACEA